MGSRLRSKHSDLFESFHKIIRSPDGVITTEINFPNRNLVEENLLKFIFPFDQNFKSPTVDHYTFTLTDLDGTFKFGFCRLSAGSQSCLCIVSFHPWFEVFYKLLDYISELMNKNKSVEWLLDGLLRQEVSFTRTSIRVVDECKDKEFSFTRPDPTLLPSIPDNRNLTEYYSAIDTYNMLIIFACMLQERRIIVTSRKLSRLTSCIYGSAAFLYPLNWQHLFIPILPSHLLEYCSAPMPFLIGIHSSILSPDRIDHEDTIILDADSNIVSNYGDDLSTLPSQVFLPLKKQLRVRQKGRASSPCVLMGECVSRAFLQAMVTLIGRYRKAIVSLNGKWTFDSEIFLNSSPGNVKPFLETVLHLQSFEQFIDERVEHLNSGRSLDRDPFEIEVDLLMAKKTKKKDKQLIRNQTLEKNENIFLDITNKFKNSGMNTLRRVRTKISDLKKSESPAYKNLKTFKDAASVNTLTVPSISRKPSQYKHIGEPHDIRLTESTCIMRRNRLKSSSDQDVTRRHSILMPTESKEDFSRWTREKLSGFEILDTVELNNLMKKFSVDDLTSDNTNDSLLDSATMSDWSCPSHEQSWNNLSMSEENNEDQCCSLPSDASLSIIHSSASINSSNVENDSREEPKVTLTRSFSRESIKLDREKYFHRLPVESKPDSMQNARQNSAPLPRKSSFSRSADNLYTRSYVRSFPAMRSTECLVSGSKLFGRVSVKDLPNVKQIVHKFEAVASKGPESTIKSPEFSKINNNKTHRMDSNESFVARQAALYTMLDQKARSPPTAFTKLSMGKSSTLPRGWTNIDGLSRTSGSALNSVNTLPHNCQLQSSTTAKAGFENSKLPSSAGPENKTDERTNEDSTSSPQEKIFNESNDHKKLCRLSGSASSRKEDQINSHLN